MPDYIDLHMHTTCSDGCHSPAELLAMVRKKNLAAFSITDHDTLGGYDAVRELLRDDDPEIIAGVELSATVDDNDMHMLAYLFDPDHEPFRAALSEFREWRVERGKKMVEKLRGLGFEITFEDVLQTAGSSAVGRPHIAETMHRLGITKSYIAAFHSYIGYGQPAYMPKTSLTPGEAIKLVHEAGGVTVLAHPGVADMYKHIDELVAEGLDGIEVYHYANSESLKKDLIKKAEKYNLEITGGSDFHGRSRRDVEIGSQSVAASCLQKLKQRLAGVS